jgi:hypothetical protein
VRNDAFFKHKLLTVVDLSHNPLQFNFSEKPFNNFDQARRRPLESLSLENTGISSANDLFSGDLSHVRQLQLNDNPITHLPDQMPPSLHNKKTVYFTDYIEHD